MVPVPNPPAATSTAPPEGGATPKAASRSNRRRKSSASPPPIAQAAPAGNGQALTRPDAQTGAGVGADSDVLERSADELKQLVTMVETESGDLRRLYADGLAKKEAGGAKLTPEDDRLKDALRDLQGAAERFNLLFQSSFSARFRNRLSRLAHPGDDHAQLQRRCKALTDKGESADQLMIRLGPAPPVYQLWKRMSRQLRRAAALCGS